MTSVTIKGVPEELLARLKHEAAGHRRSLNGEVLYRLEQSIAAPVPGGARRAASPYRNDVHGRPLTISECKDLDAEDWLRRVREVRDHLDMETTTEEIITARDYGRK